MALNAAQLAILTTELTDDTLVRGYSGMTVEAAADDLHELYRSRIQATMTGTSVAQSIDSTGYNALTADQKNQVLGVLGMGTINPNGFEKDVFVDIFGGGSITITNLAADRQESISRATELGISGVQAVDVLATGAV